MIGSAARIADVDGSDALRARIEALGPWFHNIDLGGVATAPDHFLGDYPREKFARFAAALPDVTGVSVLDIGCNAGFYALEMKRRGAARVLGIDSDPRYLAQARLAADALGWGGEVEFASLSVYDVAALGERFDLVVFMGVFYHLRHPLLALDLIREHVAGNLMLFQTLQQGAGDEIDVPHDHPFYLPGTIEPPAYFADPRYPRMHFIEHRFAGDWSNWWAPNPAGTRAMLRAAGFTVEDTAEGDVYLCRVAPVPFAEYGPAAVYPAKGPQ